MKIIDREKIDTICIGPESTIKDAMEVISQGAIGAVFVVDQKNSVFLGLITDGDIRRALLNNNNLDTRISKIVKPSSIVARMGMSSKEISKMFNKDIRVIPVLGDEDQIVDIAFHDLRFHLPVAEPLLCEKELEYVSDCILSNWISSSGKYVNRFEELFSDYCGTEFAVTASNGTTALHLSLLAFDIGPGDEVIVPSFTFIATANAVTYTGAKPVFVDSEQSSWNIDPKKIEEVITFKTKAIIPVHLYGHPADMDPILAIAKKHNLKVIEDAAEAHGAEYKGKKVGSLGDLGVFSFFGNKIITTGEGGMITTRDKRLAEKIRLLRDHGMSLDRRYWHPVLGYNYRMTNLQAAIGVAQVERIESIIQQKDEIALQYSKRFSSIEGITLSFHALWARPVCWLYSILIEDEFGITRDELIASLKDMGVDTRPVFPPVHLQPIYQTGQSLPVAEELAQKGLSLPSSAGLQTYEIDRVCDAVISKQSKGKAPNVAN